MPETVLAVALGSWWALGTPIPAVRAVGLAVIFGSLAFGVGLGWSSPPRLGLVDRAESAFLPLALPVFFLLTFADGASWATAGMGVLTSFVGAGFAFAITQRIHTGTVPGSVPS